MKKIFFLRSYFQFTDISAGEYFPNLNVHVELVVLGHRRRSSDFAPAVALVFLLLLVVIFVLGRVVSAVQLVLMIVMVERAVVALHQVAWNILRRCVTQRRVSQVHEEGFLVDDLCTWKENQNRRS